jgi:hypothetical protein
MFTVETIAATIPWYAWIPILGIVGGSLVAVVRAVAGHRERMAMIRQGIHPDAPGGKPYEGREV